MFNFVLGLQAPNDKKSPLQEKSEGPENPPTDHIHVSAKSLSIKDEALKENSTLNTENVEAKVPTSPKDMSVICISDDENDGTENHQLSNGSYKHVKAKSDESKVKSNSHKVGTSYSEAASISNKELTFASLSRSVREPSSSDMDVSFANKSFQQYRDSPVILGKAEKRAGHLAPTTIPISDSEDSGEESQLEKYVTGEGFRNMSLTTEELQSTPSPDSKLVSEVEKAKEKYFGSKEMALQTLKLENKSADDLIKSESCNADRHEEKQEKSTQSQDAGALTASEVDRSVRQKVEAETIQSLVTKRRALYENLMTMKVCG